MLTGIYSSLSAAISNVQNTHFYMAELASDDRFGGGGENDKDMQGLDHLMNTQPDRFLTFWTARYQGIFRANTAIETLDQVQGWTNEAQKNQVLGEVYFLRALYYFELSQMFGEVPLVLSTEVTNIPKNPADETYAQIAEDLKNAISLMPSTPYNTVASGHATKWAAEALDIIRDNEIHVIITDQRMPEMTGVEFLEEVIKIKPEPIRILLTGYTDMAAVVDAINKGKIFHYLNKPWKEEEISETVSRAFEIYEKKKNIIDQNSQLEISNEQLEFLLRQKLLS
jgi:CheY-like chemotaxis protein